MGTGIAAFNENLNEKQLSHLSHWQRAQMAPRLPGRLCDSPTFRDAEKCPYREMCFFYE